MTRSLPYLSRPRKEAVFERSWCISRALPATTFAPAGVAHLSEQSAHSARSRERRARTVMATRTSEEDELAGKRAARIKRSCRARIPRATTLKSPLAGLSNYPRACGKHLPHLTTPPSCSILIEMLLTVNNLADRAAAGGSRRFPAGGIAQPAANTGRTKDRAEFSDDLLEPNTGRGAI
jgi:hypothetical protein